MIVISNIIEFNNIKRGFNFIDCDLNPVEIKNNLFILGEQVLNDENFIEFFKEFTDYEIREVKQDEFIEVKK